MCMTGKMKKFFRLSRLEKWVLVEACLYLALSIVVIKLVPFRRISSYLGKHMAVSSEKMNQDEERIVNLIRLAILRVSTHLLWKSACLPLAMTAKFMLGRRGIETTLYMGVKMKESGKLSAHAWLRAGEFFVTGGSDKQYFTIVASFS